MSDIGEQAHAIKLGGKISTKTVITIEVIAIGSLPIHGATGGGINCVLTPRIPNRVSFEFARSIGNNPI